MSHSLAKAVFIQHFPIKNFPELLRHIENIVPNSSIKGMKSDPMGVKIYFENYSPAADIIRERYLCIQGVDYPIYPLVTNLTVHNIRPYVSSKDLGNLMKQFGPVLDVYPVASEDNEKSNLTWTNDFRVQMDVPEIKENFPQTDYWHLSLPGVDTAFEITFFCRLCRQNGHVQHECIYPCWECKLSKAKNNLKQFTHDAAPKYSIHDRIISKINDNRNNEEKMGDNKTFFKNAPNLNKFNENSASTEYFIETVRYPCSSADGNCVNMQENSKQNLLYDGYYNTAPLDYHASDQCYQVGKTLLPEPHDQLANPGFWDQKEFSNEESIQNTEPFLEDVKIKIEDEQECLCAADVSSNYRAEERYYCEDSSTCVRMKNESSSESENKKHKVRFKLLIPPDSTLRLKTWTYFCEKMKYDLRKLTKIDKLPVLLGELEKMIDFNMKKRLERLESEMNFIYWLERRLKVLKYYAKVGTAVAGHEEMKQEKDNYVYSSNYETACSKELDNVSSSNIKQEVESDDENVLYVSGNYKREKEQNTHEYVPKEIANQIKYGDNSKVQQAKCIKQALQKRYSVPKSTQKMINNVRVKSVKNVRREQPKVVAPTSCHFQKGNINGTSQAKGRYQQSLGQEERRKKSIRDDISFGVLVAIRRAEGILEPEEMISFLKQVRRRRHPKIIAHYFNEDIRGIKMQLEKTIYLYYRMGYRGKGEDNDIRWITQLIEKLQ